jgi:hypothetical protein
MRRQLSLMIPRATTWERRATASLSEPVGPTLHQQQPGTGIDPLRSPRGLEQREKMLPVCCPKASNVPLTRWS